MSALRKYALFAAIVCASVAAAGCGGGSRFDAGVRAVEKDVGERAVARAEQHLYDDVSGARQGSVAVDTDALVRLVRKYERVLDGGAVRDELAQLATSVAPACVECARAIRDAL